MKILALIVAMLALAIPSWAQTSVDDVHITPRVLTPPPSEQTETDKSAIKVNVNLVLVPVSVVNRDTDGPIIGLRKGHFRLYENGQEQEVRYFSSDDSPVSIGVIWDVSGSIGMKLDMERAAIQMICKNANPQDELFIVTFSDTIHDSTEFSSVTDDIESKLMFNGSEGRTALWDAVYLGINKMRAAKYQRKALIIISDGGDNHSRYTLNDVKRALREPGDVQVYSVGIFNQINIDPVMRTRMQQDAQAGHPWTITGSSLEEFRGPQDLQDISEATGGKMLLTMDQRDLIQNLQLINATIRYEYVLGYTPHFKDDKSDEKYRKLKVKLQRIPKGLPSMNVYTRNGFYPRAH